MEAEGEEAGDVEQHRLHVDVQDVELGAPLEGEVNNDPAVLSRLDRVSTVRS